MRKSLVLPPDNSVKGLRGSDVAELQSINLGTKCEEMALGRGRTLLLSSNSLWNIENFRSNLVRAFDRRGWKVVIAVPATPDQCRRSTLPAQIRPLEIDRSGVSPFADLKLFWAYYRLLRRERPAAYLGWTIKPNLYGAWAARAAGIPSILNVSGLGTAFLSGPLLSRFVSLLYRQAFQRASMVFFQNADDRDLFVKKRLVAPPQTGLVAGSGINLTHFRMSALPTEGPLRFLMIARLLGDKGVREYVAAAKICRQSLPDARFQLLGPMDEGNRTAISSAEINGWVSEGVVDYLGETNDVRPHIAAATVVVLPSYREGLSRALLEGAAMGRLLIATNVPGCRELVEDGVNGILCKPKDPNSLVEAILKLARLDVGVRAEMGRRSRQLAETRFSEDLVTDAYVSALTDAAGTVN